MRSNQRFSWISPPGFTCCCGTEPMHRISQKVAEQTKSCIHITWAFAGFDSSEQRPRCSWPSTISAGHNPGRRTKAGVEKNDCHCLVSLTFLLHRLYYIMNIVPLYIINAQLLLLGLFSVMDDGWSNKTNVGLHIIPCLLHGPKGRMSARLPLIIWSATSD